MSKTLNDFQLTDNFNLREYQSPDTGEVKIDRRVVWVCQTLRNKRKCRIFVTRGYSTEKHNKEVGGATYSRHLRGLAADLVPEDGNLLALFREATNLPLICGLGIYEDGHIHIDIDRPNKLYWAKMRNKKYRYFPTPKEALQFFLFSSTSFQDTGRSG